MKLQENQQAPLFSSKDVYGNEVKLSDLKGKKILLMFNRNVGCPVCNLQYHQLGQHAAYFKEKELVILSVYESTAESMKTYLEGEVVFSTMIPNPDLSLYALYDIERSMGKILKGLFNGLIGKAKKGKQLFRREMKQDGNANRMHAEFLIDTHGRVATAHYGKYLGDHLSIEEIKAFIR
jgi:peroxiredoxin Q/BCP